MAGDSASNMCVPACQAPVRANGRRRAGVLQLEADRYCGNSQDSVLLLEEEAVCSSQLAVALMRML